MSDALTRKLESFVSLSNEDRQAIKRLAPRIRKVDARLDLIRQGENPEDVQLILDGFACRYKILPDGQRQIMAYLIPGDFCDLNVFILDQMDHSIGTIATCRVANIARRDIEEITARYPMITRALWWCSLVDAAVLREWLVNIGGRAPDKRIAHLLCELLLRLEAVGKVTENSFNFPLTQIELADTMGLSAVHVNRTLRQLHSLELITIKKRVLKIHDVYRLRAFCDFNPNYLHFENSRWSSRSFGPWLNEVQEN